MFLLLVKSLGDDQDAQWRMVTREATSEAYCTTLIHKEGAGDFLLIDEAYPSNSKLIKARLDVVTSA